jgi:hypothetical protein
MPNRFLPRHAWKLHYRNLMLRVKLLKNRTRWIEESCSQMGEVVAAIATGRKEEAPEIERLSSPC